MAERYTVERHRESRGSVWQAGEALTWYDSRDGGFGVFLETTGSVRGPRGGIRSGCHPVTIRAETWEGVNEALAELGFEPLGDDSRVAALTARASFGAAAVLGGGDDG